MEIYSIWFLNDYSNMLDQLVTLIILLWLLFFQILTEKESETLQSAWCTIKKNGIPVFVIILYLLFSYLLCSYSLINVLLKRAATRAFSYYINPFSYSSKYDSSLILDICQNSSMIDFP